MFIQLLVKMQVLPFTFNKCTFSLSFFSRIFMYNITRFINYVNKKRMSPYFFLHFLYHILSFYFVFSYKKRLLNYSSTAFLSIHFLGLPI